MAERAIEEKKSLAIKRNVDGKIKIKKKIMVKRTRETKDDIIIEIVNVKRKRKRRRKL